MSQLRSLPLTSDDTTERVAPGYSQLLREAVEKAGLKRKDLRARGASMQSVWRVLDHKDEPSFVAAARIRKRIMELCPNLDLPPPAVAVSGVDHYEWMRLGSELIDDDYAFFRDMLEAVREAYRDMKAARKSRAKFRRLGRDRQD